MVEKLNEMVNSAMSVDFEDLDKHPCYAFRDMDKGNFFLTLGICQADFVRWYKDQKRRADDWGQEHFLIIKVDWTEVTLHHYNWMSHSSVSIVNAGRTQRNYFEWVNYLLNLGTAVGINEINTVMAELFI